MRAETKTGWLKKFLTGVMRYKYWLAIGSGVILGLIFVTSGVAKIPEPAQDFAALLFSSFPFLSPTLRLLVAQWLPWVELMLGLLLILGISTKFMASASFLLVIAFIFHNTWIIKYGLGLDDCDCFGMFEWEIQIMESAEMSRYIDIGMLALILIIIFCYPGRFFTIRPWFLKRD